MTDRALGPLPEPARANEAGSWADYTVRVRQPAILRQVLADNAYRPAIADRLHQYLASLPDLSVRLLADRHAPDALAWAGILRPYVGQSWLEIPWLVQEFAFYRYILEAVGYFDAGPTPGQDPYAVQKRRALADAAGPIESLARRQAILSAEAPLHWDGLRWLLAVSLWGNQADLSMWPAGGSQTGPAHASDSTQAAHTLVDQRGALQQQAQTGALPWGRVDIIADNAGFELLTDLCLADFVLRAGIARAVRLHVKAYPTFVSDALEADVFATLAWLTETGSAEARSLGERLQGALAEGRLLAAGDGFWNLPLAFWQMPEPLRADLAGSDLIVVKGDANYRRLLGDLHWPFTTPLEAIAGTVPRPFMALRTVKSELAAGLTAAQVRLLNATDPDWLTNGRWGVIQFMPAGEAR